MTNHEERLMELLDLLKSHTTVRDYEDTPISDETFKEMLHAAQHASSSHFVQAYSVIQVKDPAKKEALGKLAQNERQFSTAALALIFCIDLKRVENIIRKENKEPILGSVEDFIVGTVDTALLAQNFVVAAESKGYGVCYIGGVRNNPQEINDLFNLPEYVVPLFGMTVGVPAEDNEVKPRLPVEAIIHVDGYDETKDEKIIESYDLQMNEYYKERTKNRRDTNWSETMTNFFTKERRQHVKPFIQGKGFLKDI